MDRQEHLQWCKKRALQYLDNNDIPNAVASMLSDLSKHPETENHVGAKAMSMMLFTGQFKTTEEVRKFINGFN